MTGAHRMSTDPGPRRRGRPRRAAAAPMPEAPAPDLAPRAAVVMARSFSPAAELAANVYQGALLAAFAGRDAARSGDEDARAAYVAEIDSAARAFDALDPAVRLEAAHLLSLALAQTTHAGLVAERRRARLRVAPPSTPRETRPRASGPVPKRSHDQPMRVRL